MPHAGSWTTSRSWRDGRVIDDDVTPEELADALRDPEVLVWVDLLAPQVEQVAAIAAEFGLPATAVEDALGPRERPKLTRHESHLFFTTVTFDVVGDPGEQGFLRQSRVSGFVLPSALLTIRLDDGFDMGRVVARWEENSSLLRHGSGALIHGLLDVIVDGHFEAIQLLDDEMEALEDTLFAETTTDRAFVRSIYRVRKDLVELRRTVLPMRELVNGLLRHRSEDAPELKNWYDDLYDHVLRAAEWTESLRDMVASMFETNLSLQDQRLNAIMKKLAAWAAIIAVPTAITGWFGQNVPYAGFGDPAGVWASVATIAASVIVLLAVFKRWDWL